MRINHDQLDKYAVGHFLLQAENDLNNQIQKFPATAEATGLVNAWHKVNEAIEAYQKYINGLKE